MECEIIRRTIVALAAVLLALGTVTLTEVHESPLEATSNELLPPVASDISPPPVEPGPVDEEAVEDLREPLEEIAPATPKVPRRSVADRLVAKAQDALDGTYGALERGVLGVHDAVPDELRPFLFAGLGPAGGFTTTLCEFEESGECWDDVENEVKG